MMSEVD